MRHHRLYENEIQILLDFYESTSGSNWTCNKGWVRQGVSTEEYKAGTLDWYGTVWENGHLVGIELENNNLSGTLPESLTKLRKLRVLKLRFNPHLRGEVCSKMHQMKRLRYCYLDGTHLHGGLADAHTFEIIQHKSNCATVKFLDPSGTRWQIDMSQTELFLKQESLKRIRCPPVKAPPAIKRTYCNVTGPERAAAATYLQRIYRGKLARRKLRNYLKKLYVRRVDPENGQVFYLNTETGETSWKPPFGFVEDSTSPPVSRAFSAQEAEKFEQHVDARGKIYYWNPETNETTYEAPIIVTKFDQELIERYGEDTNKEERFQLFFAEIDKGDNDLFDFDDFTILCAELGFVVSHFEIEKAMEQLDTSADGLLDQSQIFDWLRLNFK